MDRSRFCGKVAIGLGIGIKPTFAYALPGLVLLHHLLRRSPPSPAAHPRRLAAERPYTSTASRRLGIGELLERDETEIVFGGRIAPRQHSGERAHFQPQPLGNGIPWI